MVMTKSVISWQPNITLEFCFVLCDIVLYEKQGLSDI